MGELQKKLQNHLNKGAVGFPSSITYTAVFIMAPTSILAVTSGCSMTGNTLPIIMLMMRYPVTKSSAYMTVILHPKNQHYFLTRQINKKLTKGDLA